MAPLLRLVGTGRAAPGGPRPPFISPEWIVEVGSQLETPLSHVETTAQRNRPEVLLSGRSSCSVCTNTGVRSDENLERSASWEAVFLLPP